MNRMSVNYSFVLKPQIKFFLTLQFTAKWELPEISIQKIQNICKCVQQQQKKNN